MRVLFPLTEVHFRIKKDRSHSERYPYVVYIDAGEGEQIWSSYLDRETAMQEAIKTILTYHQPKPQILNR